jgi:predicted ester cyclase
VLIENPTLLPRIPNHFTAIPWRACLRRRTPALPTIGHSRSVRRSFHSPGGIVAEGDYIACQTWIEGTFLREFAPSPAGPLPPNGQRVVWNLLNIFRFDDQGRLVKEWVRTDCRSFLRQLGAQGK